MYRYQVQAFTAAAFLFFTSFASAAQVAVTIENVAVPGGFAQTPYWVSVHDGDFDIWSGGQFADEFPGLEELAEEGDTSAISQRFSESSSGQAGGMQATITATNVGVAVLDEGESSGRVVNVENPALNRYFSYASMIIPSNDLFFATSVPTTHAIFDENGNFTGPVTIEIYGRDVVDAGTEVNNIDGGAAFSANGGDAADERNPLADIYVLDPAADYLNSIVGTETVTGRLVDRVFGEDELIARITISEASTPELNITVENAALPGGFFLTPMWVAAHNGEFDVWSGGEPASNFTGLEELAEEGDTAPITAAFSNSPAGLAGGAQATILAERRGAPVYSPGEAATFRLGVGDPLVNRYFSYASMIIPSNDLFVATSVPTTHELFDELGNFAGPVTVEIYGRDVVDAGTEVNDINGGAAFSVNGGEATDESEVLDDLFDRDPAGDYLQTILGTGTPTGDTITTAFGPDDLVARITVTLV
ncbi:MAG: spondin domain-containing protein, partial [Planctomycetota bacterium]